MSCPDCGTFFACPKCSAEYSRIDLDIKRRANNPRLQAVNTQIADCRIRSKAAIKHTQRLTC